MLSKILLLLSASAVAVSLTVFFNSTKRSVRAQNELAQLVRQQTELEASVAELRRTIETTEGEMSLAQERIAFLRKIEFVDATVPATPQEVEKAETTSLAEQEQKARDFRSRLVAQYGPFYYKMGLTDPQIDRFENIQTEHWQNTADLKAVAKAKQLKDDDASTAELREKADELRQTETKQLLGENSFQLLQDYERSLPAREIVSSIAERLYYTPAPLNAVQAEKLTQLLATHNAAYAKGEVFVLEQTDWTATIQKVPAILSEKQRETFNEVYGFTVLLPAAMDASGEKLGPVYEALAPPSAK